MMSLGLSSTSDVITYDQNWHYLYSTSAGGKDLCDDAKIRVIGLMGPEISTTRHLASCTQAIVILRSTSYIAIELNVLHLK